MKKIIKLFVFCLLGIPAFAQPVKQADIEFPQRQFDNPLFQPDQQSNLRLEAAGLTVPFLDNFNYLNISDFYTNWDSSGIEIVKLIDAPASTGARFNGIKSNKQKYSADTVLRVPTDYLISKPITSTASISDSSAYLEFVWQGGGADAQPDSTKGDSLVLYALVKDSTWIRIWHSPGTFDKTRFYIERFLLPNLDYNYANLRFKFQAFGPSQANVSTWYISNFGIGRSNSLPFWDDFSNVSNLRKHFKANTGVYINNHMALNQPSLNVATFDGVDDLGKPYYKTSEIEMGMADSLVSWPINLDSVSAGISKKDSLRFGFFYQRTGLGEEADLSEGDSLVLLFYNKNKQWKSVWHSSFTETIDPTKFYQVLLTVKDSSFFHEDFKFKFFNYARLSGAFDAWHIDYLTLDTIKTTSSSLLRRIVDGKLYFSDVAVSSAPKNILKTYHSIPANHITSSNLNFFPGFDFVLSDMSPLQTTVIAESNVSNTSPTLNLGQGSSTTDLQPGVTLLTQAFSNLNQSFPSQVSDSLKPFQIIYKVNLAPDPKFPNTSGYPFYNNNIDSSVFTFDNYYAYDDGTYEIGEMLEQSKAMQAMGFDIYQPDTLTHIDICIPYVGYNISGAPFFLKVWEDFNGKPGRELYSSARVETAKYSTGRNPFTRYTIKDKTVLINKRFYVGYLQVKGFTQALRVGYDASVDNNGQLWYDNNQGHGWSQRGNIPGTLMIRPVFANQALNIPLKREETEFSMEMYPNPNNTETLTLNAEFGWVFISDFNGNKKILVYNTDKLNVSSLNPGLYLVVGQKDGKIYNKKLIIEAR